MTAGQRRERLRTARLYLVASGRPGGRPLQDVLEPALAGGVDLFQLRDKGGDDERVLAAARVARELCSAHGALFFVNDRPDLAVAAGADGVHVGQDDLSVARAREIVGPERLVGLSTHTPAQIDAADADLIGVGPVHATPTKLGRPAAGIALVGYAAAHAAQPWFAIGGIDETNVGDAIAAGARRVAVVRAIADAPDPRAAAYRLREMLDTVTPDRGPARTA
jgi:thiamine-phosphate pyrophosphorylase